MREIGIDEKRYKCRNDQRKKCEEKRGKKWQNGIKNRGKIKERRQKIKKGELMM